MMTDYDNSTPTNQPLIARVWLWHTFPDGTFAKVEIPIPVFQRISGQVSVDDLQTELNRLHAAGFTANAPGMKLGNETEEIYAAVIIEPRVTAIKVRYEGLGNYVKLPLWGAVRICLGPDDPGWTEEWSNRGVTDIQMVRPDGSTREFNRLDPSNTVSIAPLRD